MALRKVVRGFSLFSRQNQNLLGYQHSRTAAYWNKDWKPGPYPKTEEERVAAARKYNLIREDYEPYPDDGDGLGDYPMLPLVSSDARDLDEEYDMPEFPRNFGEPLHADFLNYTSTRGNEDIRQKYTPWQKAGILFGTFGLAVFLMVVTEEYPVHQPVMDQQMPGENVVHYVFEKP